MATLWIREYGAAGGVAADAGEYPTAGPLTSPIAQEPGTDQTPVTFSTSAQSAAFAAGTRYVTIIGSAAFHFVCAANPTATTSHLKIPADTPYSFGVVPTQKLAVIAAA